MDQLTLDTLITGIDFVAVTATMLAIGGNILLVHGAWKAYKFVSKAVKGG